ncbi:MAG: aldose 1-epimerase [Geminicoccaceae bacterium]
MLELSRGDLSLALLPEAGAAIVRLTCGGVDVLRRGDPGAVARDPTEAACFPLVPYSGPVVGGRFPFDGIEHRLARTHPNEPEPIHGEGWVAVWEAVDHRTDTAILRYHHLPRSGAFPFPFPYLAEQRIALDRGRVTIGVSVTNLGDRPMPAGIGVHPYFPDRRGLRLHLAAGGVWSRRPLDRDGPAVLPVPPDWSFAEPRAAAALVVDDSFPGWAGKAELSWADRGLAVEITADPLFRFVQLFSTADEDFLCVEPVSNANDGFNLMAAGIEQHGVQLLAPGQRLAGAMSLEVRQAG